MELEIKKNMCEYPLKIVLNIFEKNNWILEIPEGERDSIINSVLELGYLVKNSIQLQIGQSEDGVCESIAELRELILGKFITSSVKGRLGEKAIYEWCKQDFSDEFIEDTAKKDHCGDCHVGEGVGVKVMIDSKVYSNAVPTHEIDKLKSDMDASNIKLAVLVSFRSSITGKKRWSIDRYNDGYVLYIPHMGDKFVLISMGIQFLRKIYNMEKVCSKRYLPYDFDKRCEEIMKGLERLVDINSEMDKHSTEILETKEKLSHILNDFLKKSLKRTEIINRHSKFIREIITNELKSLTHDTLVERIPGEIELLEFLERKKDKKTELLGHLLAILKRYNIKLVDKSGADSSLFALKQCWEWELWYQSRNIGVIQAKKTSIWFLYRLDPKIKQTRQAIRNVSEMGIFECILKIICHL